MRDNWIVYSASQFIDILRCFLGHTPDMESRRSIPPHPIRVASDMSWREGVGIDEGVLMYRKSGTCQNSRNDGKELSTLN